MYRSFKILYRVFLILLTGCAVLISLLMLFSGGFAVAGLTIVGPFVFGVIAILWVIYYHLDRIHGSWSGPNRAQRYLAYSVLLFILIGAILLIQFAMVGGPNNGQGKFLLSSADNPYWQMQLGLASLLLAGILSIITAIVRRISKG